MDTIQKIDSSVVQHGKVNDRIYLMHLAKEDSARLPAKLLHMAQENEYSKIFAKVPSSVVQYFQKYNFFKEAYVPGFYSGKIGMYCMSKFIDPDRAEIPLHDRLEIHKILQLTKTRRDIPPRDAVENIIIRQLNDDEIGPLTHLYDSVFETYPFPIFEPDYIEKTMNDDVCYFGAFHGEHLVAAAAADIAVDEKNAELTDFATLSEYRGQNLAQLLLEAIENEMRYADIRCLYTIARALSPAMNITFAKAGYYFAGTLKNNTNIGGKIQSMNIWYKLIEDLS
jgi:putative beta-lysine N-acetyltransferase